MADQADDETQAAGTATPPPSEVLFRKAYLVQNMCIHPNDKVRFERVGERAVSIDFGSVGWDARQRWWRSPSLRCTATVRSRMPRRCVALFEAVWHGRVPEGVCAEDLVLDPSAMSGTSDPAFREGRVPAFLREAMAPIEGELERATARVVGLARWRCNRTGPVDLPAMGFLEWSVDGASWKLDPRRPTMLSVGLGPDLVVNEARRADIERMLAEGEDEPLHQSLLREAESLLESSPRSALVIGATATEVAIKSLVSALAPQTSWLVQNLPSPPVAKLVEEYLPILLPSGSPAFAPELLRGLKTAVALRNELVHGARTTLEPSRLSSALQVFRDVVWLCDYFSGMSWAVNRVSRDTLAAMQLQTTVDASGWFVD